MCALVVRDPDQAVITAATRRPALSEEEQEQRRKDVRARSLPAFAWLSRVQRPGRSGFALQLR